MDYIGDYIQLFLETFPKRAKAIQQQYSQKLLLDRKIKNGNIPSQNELRTLLSLIGENHFFISTKKRKKQNLQHGIYKLSKSLSMYLKNVSIDDMTTERENTDLLYFLKSETPKLYSLGRLLLLHLQSLGGILKQEASAIKSGNADAYKLLLQQEQSTIFSINALRPQIEAIKKTFIQKKLTDIAIRMKHTDDAEVLLKFVFGMFFLWAGVSLVGAFAGMEFLYYLAMLGGVLYGTAFTEQINNKALKTWEKTKSFLLEASAE